MDEVVELLNPHWEGGFSYGYERQRLFFPRLRSLVDKGPIVAVVGGRRTGKTVLLRQLMDHLVARGEQRRDILYFSFDDHGRDLLRLLREYAEFRGRGVREGRYFVLLDEVQKLPNWQGALKLIYDALPNVRFVVSGSSLSTAGSGGLAGRVLEVALPPLLFQEYMHLRGRDEALAENVDVLETEYRTYMARSLPELALGGVEPREYVASIVRKVVNDDAGRDRGRADPELLHALVRIILRSPGQVINYSDLSRDLGVERRRLSDHLGLLERSFLVRKLYSFARGPRKVERRAKRFHPFAPVYCQYLREAPEEAALVECDAAFQLGAGYFYRDEGREIDLVLPELSLAVEVKCRERIDPADLRWLGHAGRIGMERRLLVVKPTSRLSTTADVERVTYHTLWATQYARQAWGLEGTDGGSA